MRVQNILIQHPGIVLDEISLADEITLEIRHQISDNIQELIESYSQGNGGGSRSIHAVRLTIEHLKQDPSFLSRIQEIVASSDLLINSQFVTENILGTIILFVQ